jgi:hypothetical protein
MIPGLTITPNEPIDILYQWGPWQIHTTWPTRASRQDLQTTIRISNHDTPEPRYAVSSQRLNLYSGSQKAGLVTAMRRLGKEDELSTIVHHICEDLITRFKQYGSIDTPTPQLYTGNRYLLYPIWPAFEGTLLNAASNSFKSFFGIAIAAQATLGIEILQGNTRPTTPTPILYLDGEGHHSTFAERLYAILAGIGHDPEPCVQYRHLAGQSFADIAPHLADEITDRGIGGVIIDSLSAMIGGSLNDDDIANRFWDAVSLLEVPVLVLAHKSREAVAKNRKAVFGSSMHENRPRFAWDAVRPDPNGPAVKWEVYNDNNLGMQGHKLAWNVQIEAEGEHEHRHLATATFAAANPNDASMTTRQSESLSDDIFLLLFNEGPLTAAEIAGKLGKGDGTIRKTIQRDHGQHLEKNRDGVRWQLKDIPE